MFERLQSQATAEVVGEPYVLAARARGVPRRRLVWRDALKPSLRPIAAIYGLVVGTLLSGSFVVEIVTAWPGLGRLMLDALLARDVYLVAGCAAAGSVFLAVGTLLSGPRARRRRPARRGAGRLRRAAGLALLVAWTVAGASGRAAGWRRTSRAAAPRVRERAARPGPAWSTIAADGTRRSSTAGSLASRLEQRYEQDRSARLPLAWFGAGRLVRSSDPAPGAARADGHRRARPRRVRPAAVRRPDLARPGRGRGGRRDGHRAARRRRSPAPRAAPSTRRLCAAPSSCWCCRPSTWRSRCARCCRSCSRRDDLPPGSPPSSRSSARRSWRAACAPSSATERGREYRSRRGAIGAGRARVLVRHLLPATRGFLVVQAHAARAGVHRGRGDALVRRLGFPDPTPSWGAMLHEAANVHAVADFPWLLAPAAAIFLVLGLNLSSSARRPALIGDEPWWGHYQWGRSGSGRRGTP